MKYQVRVRCCILSFLGNLWKGPGLAAFLGAFLDMFGEGNVDVRLLQAPWAAWPRFFGLFFLFLFSLWRAAFLNRARLGE